jgi:hypothetical protein
MDRNKMNGNVRGNAWAAAATLCSVLALGACSSARLGSVGPGPAVAGTYPQAAPMPEPVEAVPSGPVVSEPLPPIGGQGPVGSAPLPGTPGSTYGTGTDIAALPSQPAAPIAPSPAPAPGRSSLVGSWTARDASGASCRVQLSSAPALDLYRASTSGCSNKDLSRISAWDYRDGEVYLYQSGGTVAARLRASGGSLSGVLAKSGAPVTLAR